MYNAIIFCWNQLVHIFLEDLAFTQLYLLTQYCISLFRWVGRGLNTKINSKRSVLSYPLNKLGIVCNYQGLRQYSTKSDKSRDY